MKLSRRSLLAGCAGAVSSGMLSPGHGITATIDRWLKPTLWKMEAEILAKSKPAQNPVIVASTTTGGTTLTLPVAGRRTSEMALNASGRIIWNACDGKHTVEQIVECVSGHFDIRPEQAYVDCMAFLFHLKSFNAILV